MPIPAMRRRTFIVSRGGTAAWPIVAREHREPDNFVRRSNYDIYGISLQKAAAQGPWPRDGVRGGGKRRSHRIPARQPHILVSLAQCDTASRAAGALHCPRSDRHGRLRKAAWQWPWLLS